MKLKKAEAYIDTVVTVFINLIILYLVLNLFSYMITYQKLNHAADNIIRCVAIHGTTDNTVIESDISEYIANEGFDPSEVNVSFSGTEYMNGSTETVQFGDKILLNIKTNRLFKFIGKAGSSIFNLSINKTSLSEKYYQNTNIIVNPMPPNFSTGTKRNGIIPSNGIYYKGGECCITCVSVYGIQGMNHGPMFGCDYTFTQSPTATYTSGQTFPATVEVGDIYVEDDFRYCYDFDGWYVSVFEDKALYNGTILSEINGKKVKYMYATFMNCTSLTTVPEIPNSVTNIANAFQNCTSLTTAPVIPNSVTDMYSTFSGCTSLTTAPVIPSSVTDMQYAFYNCTLLTTAPEIPSGVTNMRYTFYGCTSLTTAPVIPNSVTDMRNTFQGCTSLTTAPEIPSSVTNMSDTFNGCTSLTTAPVIPSSVTGMSGTFSGCSSLTTAPTIPNSVTDMSGTFFGCASLTTAPAIPSSVANMRATFYNCASLTTAPTIPSSVTDMVWTFRNCTSLTGTIEVNANPTSYTSCLESTQITGITGSCSQTTKNRLMATK